MSSLSVTDFSEVYSNPEQDICSRHSILLSELTLQFEAVYGGYSPEGLVMLNGQSQFDFSDQGSLSMSLENGLWFLFSRVGANEGIYINGNHFSEEIIFGPDGSHQEGIHPFVESFRNSLKIEGRQDGAIIYVHSSVYEKHFRYDQLLQLGICLTSLELAGVRKEMSVPALIQKVMSIQPHLKEETVKRALQTNSLGSITFTDRTTTKQLPLKSDLRIICCKMDVQPEGKVQSKPSIPLVPLISSEGSSAEIIDEKYSMSSMSTLDEESYLSRSLIRGCPYSKLTNQFASGLITFPQYLHFKYNLDTELGRVPKDLANVLEEVALELPIISYGVVEEQYLMLAVKSTNLSEVIHLLQNLVKQNRLSTRKHVEDRMQNRFEHNTNINELIFSTLPSLGCAFYYCK